MSRRNAGKAAATEVFKGLIDTLQSNDIATADTLKKAMAMLERASQDLRAGEKQIDGLKAEIARKTKVLLDLQEDLRNRHAVALNQVKELLSVTAEDLSDDVEQMAEQVVQLSQIKAAKRQIAAT